MAVVGMTGSGKSEVARVLQGHGFSKVRFGDITDEEVKKCGLPLNEASEREGRQGLRQPQRRGGPCLTKRARHD